GIFFDDNHERLAQNYRSSFMRLAIHYLYSEQNKEMALQSLDRMQQIIPRDVIKMPYGLLYEISNIYYAAGGIKQYEPLAREIEKVALKQLDTNPGDVNSYYSPYRVLTDVYGNLKEYKKAADIWARIQQMYPNDPTVKSELEKYRALASGAANPAAPKQ
ncbi:MAG: DUF2723 domain-containing protein, partial [Bacillota bacterium]